MAMRVCSQPGCPTLTPAGARGGRCQVHAREADRARGTKAERGYGPEHQRIRADLVRRINAGEVITCWSCGVRLTPATLHLDHDDNRDRYRGPACASCNLSLAGKKSH